MRDGTFKSNYATGEPFAEVEYRDGLRHGQTTKYHKNGNILMSCKFVKDKRDGICVTYNEDGTVKTKEQYDHGTYKGSYL